MIQLYHLIQNFLNLPDGSIEDGFADTCQIHPTLIFVLLHLGKLLGMNLITLDEVCECLLPTIVCQS